MLKTEMRTLKLTVKLLQCLIAATGISRVGPNDQKSTKRQSNIIRMKNSNVITINLVQCNKFTNV